MFLEVWLQRRSKVYITNETRFFSNLTHIESTDTSSFDHL